MSLQQTLKKALDQIKRDYEIKNAQMPERLAKLLQPGPTAPQLRADSIAQQVNALSNEAATLKRVHDDIIESRKHRGTDNYSAKQKEYIEWSINEYGNDLVTGDRMVCFLQNQVIGRQHKRQREGQPIKYVGEHTAILYKTAITDLYQIQVTEKRNSSTHPRLHPLLAKQIKKVKSDKAALKRTNLEDRGKGTLVDGYANTREFQAIADYYLSNKAKQNIRDRSMFLLAHYMVQRGQDVRFAEWADIFLYELPNQDTPDRDPIQCLVMSMRQGKTNQFGKLQYAAMVRARNPYVCAVGGLALHLFERVHQRGDSLANICSPKEWYYLKIFPGKAGGSEELKYSTHSKAVKTALEATGIQSTKTTHVGRKAIKNVDATDDQKRAMGRWANDSMSGSYGDALPIDGIIRYAGYRSRAEYFLARNAIIPCEKLQQMIFPELEGLEFRYNQLDANEKHISGKGYIQMLKWFRIVILQDACVLESGHEIFKYCIFQSELFKTFKEQLLAAIEVTKEPMNIQIDRALPGVLDAFQKLFDLVNINGQKQQNYYQDVLLTLKDSVDNMMDKIRSQDRKIQELLHQSTRGPITATTTTTFNFQSLATLNNENDGMEENDIVSENEISLAGGLEILNSRATADENNESTQPAAATGNGTSAANISGNNMANSMAQPSNTNSQLAIPVYKFSRDCNTLRECWQEWFVGISGYRSIREMELLFKGKYRIKDKEWFHRHKSLYQEFDKGLQYYGGNPNQRDAIIARLQVELDATPAKSINSLCKRLKQSPLLWDLPVASFTS